MMLNVTSKKLLDDLQKLFLYTKKIMEDFLILVKRWTSRVLGLAKSIIKLKKFWIKVTFLLLLSLISLDVVQ